MNSDRDGALSGDEFGEPALPIGVFDSIHVGQVSPAECLAKRWTAFMGADCDGDVHLFL